MGRDYGGLWDRPFVTADRRDGLHPDHSPPKKNNLNALRQAYIYKEIQIRQILFSKTIMKSILITPENFTNIQLTYTNYIYRFETTICVSNNFLM